MIEDRDSESGLLRLEEGIIRYECRFGRWELPVYRVKVLGEYTNRDGPYLDDYFLAFVTDADGWYEASFYAAGRDAFLRDLGLLLGEPLRCGLTQSTEPASRVMWPGEIAGGKLVEVYHPPRPGGFWGSYIRHAGVTLYQRFTPGVLEALNGRKGSCSVRKGD